MRTIEFKKNEYDPQIDYIKGICILFVIWTHCINRYELGIMLYPYWGDTAVPIFLLIQVFHYFKKGVELRIPQLLKLWKRIILPFVIMIALMFMVQFFIYFEATNGVFSPSFYWDKRGPGSYYIFIYLELAFVIPLFVPLIKKLSIKWLFVVFVTKLFIVVLTVAIYSGSFAMRSVTELLIVVQTDEAIVFAKGQSFVTTFAMIGLTAAMVLSIQPFTVFLAVAT